MTTVITYEKVKDHSKWMGVFKGDAVNRKGSNGGTIYQFDDDPNQHYIVFDWDEEGMKEFMKKAQTPEMKKIFQSAGVLDQSFHVCSHKTRFEK
jgi:hypothetical protein